MSALTNLSILPNFKITLSKVKHIVIVTGAGLSAASGIPTFRGAGGLWCRYDAMSLATPEAFEEGPSIVWQFYHYRTRVAGRAQPNAAHCAITLLSSSKDELDRIVSLPESISLITRNIDGLSI
ncbi:hypothetical protein M422DRAFT_190241 [Sphaerobolus stellatus SS14]|uniref:Deacetylase sirtuin-type domain-containing protein n=1 Tax=Sphaerobolus stellatus (strain SS14) TaxID=990650 RepID=A0A0C9UGG5_SPHS4|nr:hypothetical protein M422DRAFT_190241 [Sphaerobolus stellatus SS14]